APALAADDCQTRVEEFALPTQMGLGQEGLLQYPLLLQQCLPSLQATSDLESLPTADQHEPILALGRTIHQRRRDSHAQETSSTLTTAKAPPLNTDALRGIGPDNAA